MQNGFKYAYQKALHGVKMHPNYYRILITLLDYADEYGNNAFPGLTRLAADACISVRTAQRAIEWCRTNGWVHQLKPGGRSGDGTHWAAAYSLTLPQHVTGDRLTTASIGQIGNVNRSNRAPQHVTRDHPPDHVPPDHVPPSAQQVTDDGLTAEDIEASKRRAQEAWA